MKSNKFLFSGWPLLGMVLGGLGIITFSIAWLNWDFQVATFFSQSNWAFGQNTFFVWLYSYGAYFSIGLIVLSIIGWILSFIFSQWQSYRKICVLILLTAAIGSGFLINGVLKPYWGRPRPVQIEQFGGPWEYREFYEPGIAARGQSFPSGHVSIVSLFLVCVFAWKQSRRLAISGVLFGTILTISMSICRMAQGGHFLTDTIWAAGSMILTAMVFENIFFKENPKKHFQKIPLWGYAVLILLIGGLLFLTVRKPFYETVIYTVPEKEKISSLVIEVSQPISANVVYKKILSPRIVTNVKGASWLTYTPTQIRPLYQKTEKTGFMFIEIVSEGNLIYMKNEIIVELPLAFRKNVSLSFISP